MKGFIKEVAKYCSVRNLFIDGILRVNMRRKTEQDVKKHLKDSVNITNKNAQVLLILEDIDRVEERMHTFWFEIGYLIQHLHGVKIIVTRSKKWLYLNDKPSNMKQYSLVPLLCIQKAAREKPDL